MFKILYRFSELGLECEYLVLDTGITTPFILRDPGSVNGSEDMKVETARKIIGAKKWVLIYPDYTLGDILLSVVR